MMPASHAILQPLATSSLIAGLALGLGATSVVAQSAGVASSGEMMYWSQLSRWVPDGGDSAISAVADTALALFWPPPVRAGAPGDLAKVFTADLAGGWDLHLQLSPSGRATGFTFDSDPDFYFERDYGSLLYEALAQLGTRRFSAGRWADTLAMSHGTPARRSNILGSTYGGDTISWRRIRSGRVVGEVSRAGKRWLVVAGQGEDSIRIAQYIESDFVRMREVRQSTGILTESYLYEPTTSRIDSLRQHVEWRVSSRYEEPSGVPTVVHGRWTADRMAGWGPDLRQQREDADRYFLFHGRFDSGDSSGFPPQVRRLVEASMRGDTLALDSLFRRRATTGDMRERWELEQALMAAMRGRGEGDAFQRQARASYRTGDYFIAWLTVNRWGQETVDTGVARVLVDVFTSLLKQRQNALDRQEAFGNLLPLISQAESVTASAAPIFAAGANQTDDSNVRDLFYLAAYRGQPAKYLTLLESRTDSLTGYGPIVRRYGNGDPGLLGESWGANPEHDGLFPGDPMPPLTGRWQAHEKRANGFTSYWDSQRLREWTASHQPDAAEILRQRFATEPDPQGRLVWAQYLFALGDTAPAPWVRAVEEHGDSATSAKALWLMWRFPFFADTLRSGPEVDQLQWQMLGYAAGIWKLLDEDGRPIAGFAAHDERPDLRLLSSDNLTEYTRADPRWRQYFAIVGPDSLRSRAEREGLVMAFHIATVTRVGHQYKAEISLLPYLRPGGMCLCGGGTMLTFIRRDGKWVVSSSMAWVS
jgi:hypothetical protein